MAEDHDDRISEQIQQLERAASVQEHSARLAGVAKEAAILNALVTQSSSAAMMKAAREVSAALDRSAASADQSTRALVTWTKVMAIATVVLALLTVGLLGTGVIGLLGL